MNFTILLEACKNVGLVEPISIEPDGTVWTGIDPDRIYADMKPIHFEYDRLMADEPRKQVERQRQVAYQQESDPLFFQWQRGDVAEQDWLDAVRSVKDRFPYPA